MIKRRYDRYSLTEEKEFRDIYGMDVVEIPTNRVVQRKDLDDAVYMTKKEKFNAVVEAVKEAHAKHQPVLVGTITIETSELLSRMLKREGIPHNVLNAKFHELEAEIVAQAGQQMPLPSRPTWQAVVPISSLTMWQERPAV